MGAWIEKGRATNRKETEENGVRLSGVTARDCTWSQACRSLVRAPGLSLGCKMGAADRHTRVLAFTIYWCQTCPPRTRPRQKLHTSEEEDGMKADCQSHLDH